MENNINSNFNLSTNELKTKMGAESLLDMADGIPDEKLSRDPIVGNQSQQPQSEAEKVLAQEEQLANALAQNVNIGPKYLQALQQVEKVSASRSLETELPILRKKVEITPITGAEEQILKTASITPESFLRKLNEMLYNHSTFSDNSKPSFKEFLGELFPPDKSVLIWGLLSSSYVVLPTIEKECDSCGKLYTIEGSPNYLMHSDTFEAVWDQDVSPAHYTIQQTVLDGFITFEFGLPSELDRIVITSLIDPDAVKATIEREGKQLTYMDTLVFFTKSITIDSDGTKTVLTDLAQDVYPFVKNLSPKITDAIRTQVDLSIFDKYMPNFYLKTTCDHCGAEEKVVVDPELTFFRKTLLV
jgi:hypothetical protein